MAGPQLNLLLLTLSSSALLAVTAAVRPYKNRLLNELEIFHLVLLLLISSTFLFTLTIGYGQMYIYIVLVGMSFLLFVAVFIGHIWHTIKTKIWLGKQINAPVVTEQRVARWQQTRIRREEEEVGEVVTLPKDGVMNSEMRERGNQYRESVLELAN